jgi:hypothetical protein
VTFDPATTGFGSAVFVSLMSTQRNRVRDRSAPGSAVVVVTVAAFTVEVTTPETEPVSENVTDAPEARVPGAPVTTLFVSAQPRVRAEGDPGGNRVRDRHRLGIRRTVVCGLFGVQRGVRVASRSQRFAGVEQSSDSEVFELAEFERYAFDSFGETVDRLGRPVRQVRSMPGEEVVAPRTNGSAVPSRFGRAGAVGEVLDDLINPAGRIIEIMLLVGGPHDFLSDNRP